MQTIGEDQLGRKKIEKSFFVVGVLFVWFVRLYVCVRLFVCVCAQKNYKRFFLANCGFQNQNSVYKLLWYQICKILEN